MVAISGSWKAKFTGSQILATQWGTGYNPIHASRDGGKGRGTAIHGNTNGIIDPVITQGDYSGSPNEYGYALEDETSVLWGYGTETGTADRQAWEQNHDLTSSSTDIPSTGTPYPAWGRYPEGVPGGTAIRAEDHGALAHITPKQQQYENAAAGWLGKQTSELNDADMSDVSQLYMQTSSMQRDKTRAGSQQDGTASEFDAPIASRTPGMIEKKWSDDPHRLYDMEPKAQDMIVRPWYMRSAGTGRAYDMQVNEVTLNDPLNRRPPDNPYVGASVGADDDSMGPDYGYTSDELGWGFY